MSTSLPVTKRPHVFVTKTPDINSAMITSGNDTNQQTEKIRDEPRFTCCPGELPQLLMHHGRFATCSTRHLKLIRQACKGQTALGFNDKTLTGGERRDIYCPSYSPAVICVNL